jgi:hypothetical protein
LQAKGIDLADCELTASGRADDWTGAEIRHTATNSMFAFSVEPTEYSFMLSVPDGPNSETSCKNWDDVLEQLGHWAEEVRYVAETPDFWTELQQVPEILAASQAADASNAPFTPDEQAEISARIDQAKDAVRQENPELNGEQLAAIEQGLDEVKEASTRVGRKAGTRQSREPRL